MKKANVIKVLNVLKYAVTWLLGLLSGNVL